MLLNEDVHLLHKPKNTATPKASIFFLISSSKRRILERSENAEALGQTISFFFSTALMQAILVVFSHLLWPSGLCVAVRDTHRSNKTWNLIRSRAQPWLLMEINGIFCFTHSPCYFGDINCDRVNCFPHARLLQSCKSY